MDLCVCWSQQMKHFGTKLVKDDVNGIFVINFNCPFLTSLTQECVPSTPIKHRPNKKH